jgi:hypothetical protein
MTRLTGTLVATLLLSAGPWGGCERDPVTPDPVTPPASPPPERALFDAVDGPDTGIILIDAARRRG